MWKEIGRRGPSCVDRNGRATPKRKSDLSQVFRNVRMHRGVLGEGLCGCRRASCSERAEYSPFEVLRRVPGSLLEGRISTRIMSSASLKYAAHLWSLPTRAALPLMPT